MFLHLFGPVASALAAGDIFKKHNLSHLELFTNMLFYLSDKDRNSERIECKLISRERNRESLSIY